MQKNKLNDSSAEKKLVGSFWKGKTLPKGPRWDGVMMQKETPRHTMTI